MKFIFALLAALSFQQSNALGGIERDELFYTKGDVLNDDLNETVKNHIIKNCNLMFVQGVNLEIQDVELSQPNTKIYKIYATFIDRDNFANLGTSEILVSEWKFHDKAEYSIIKAEATHLCTNVTE